MPTHIIANMQIWANGIKPPVDRRNTTAQMNSTTTKTHPMMAYGMCFY